MAEDVTAEQLSRQLRDPKLAAAFYEQLMGRVLEVTLPFAQKRTPVLTGATVESESTSVERGGLRGFLEAGTIYSPFVHARVPFFVLGIADAQSEIARILEDAGGDYFQAVIE